MSGMFLSVLCEIYLFISTFVRVVPPQHGVSGRHPYLIMVGYTIYVPVLICWYLVRLTKMLWTAALCVVYRYTNSVTTCINIGVGTGGKYQKGKCLGGG